MRRAPLSRSALALDVAIMTATMAPGDAIGNYALTLQRLFTQWGARVRLFADAALPAVRRSTEPSLAYPGSGQGLLWYHYSIYSENVHLAAASRDYKVLDFHGITPPSLFDANNGHIAELCRLGLALLPTLRDRFDRFVVHTEYMRGVLLEQGFPAARIDVLPLCVDTSRYGAGGAETLPAAARLNYLLFVGRIIPQKDIAAMVRIFGAVHHLRDDLALLLVGSHALTPEYKAELDGLIAELGLGGRVSFLGQVNDPSQLAALFAGARLLLVTSEWESFCVPLAEAAHFGTPAVVDNRPPLPEVAGPAGLVIDKRAPEAAAKAIVDLLADTPRYTAARAQAAAWATRYTDEALAANLLALLRGWFNV